jgi:hypothetical protein
MASYAQLGRRCGVLFRTNAAEGQAQDVEN